MKKYIFFTIFILICILNIKLFSFELADDKWFGDDKVAHGVGSLTLCSVLDNYTKMNTIESALTTLALGVMWEVKDGAFPYQKYGAWGGDNFSTKDLAWDAGGILTYLVLEKLKPKKSKRFDIQVKCNNKVKTLHFEFKF